VTPKFEKIISFFIPYYKVAFRENRNCGECGGEFYKNQPKEYMNGYAIIKYCDCGNRIVIGYDGKIYEK
jgi:hypothetical protein